jgi:primosomal protein N' (replication factor Y)
MLKLKFYSFWLRKAGVLDVVLYNRCRFMPKFYYQIVVVANNIRMINGKLPTYYSDEKMCVGAIVKVDYSGRKMSGVVFSQVKKPKFETKPIETTKFKLQNWQIEASEKIASFYCTPINQVISLFLPGDLHVKSRDSSASEAILKKNDSESSILKLKLNNHQKKALSLIKNSSSSTFIIEGETGSGKSYLYLQMVIDALQSGGSVIVLTPEISLSPQLIKLFELHLDIPIFHVSSNLTKARKRKIWQQVNAAEQAVIIGPRSALFMPAKNLKLVIIDEFHESTYKNDSAPKYNTQVVASIITQLLGGKLVLGSATPRIQDIWMAEKKHIPIIKLSKFKDKSPLVEIDIVDQNNKLEFKKSRIFSDLSLTKIKATLQANRQVLIFHNQRGTSRALICSECDWIYRCKYCDSRLVFHQVTEKQFFSCHTCARNYNLVTKCDSGHQSVKLIGFGTRKIVEEISRLMPGTDIVRVDTDQKDVTETLNLIKSSQAQIIVGTQMLAKGHNFENLSLVVVPLADIGLGSTDFTAPEKTYQLLHQVIGRVGRFDHPGQVVIQSFSPNNRIIQLATKFKFRDFYDYEIKERRLSLMPPFSFALKVWVIYASSDYAVKKLNNFTSKLNKIGIGNIRILGPSPATQRLVSGKHKIQIIILSTSRSELQTIIEHLPANFNFDIDPVNFL